MSILEIIFGGAGKIYPSYLITMKDIAEDYIKIIKKIVDLFIPKQGTKEYRKVTQLLKDAASSLKIEWLYINRICLFIVTFFASIVIFSYLHTVAIDYIYTEPTTNYDIIRRTFRKR